MSWHMSERLMGGVVLFLTISTITSLGNAIYLAKTLNTTPSLPDRVLSLEIKLSAGMVTLSKVNDTLEKFNATLDRIGTEQAVRKPTIDRVRRHLDADPHRGKK